MAIIPNEFYKTRSDGVNLFRTYSDLGMRIVRNDGKIFEDAIDIEGHPYTYKETDIPIDGPDEITDSEALAIIRGEAE